MNTLEQHKLQTEYEELVHKKLTYMLNKQMVPEYLNQSIKRLAQVLGLTARYGDSATNFLYTLSKLYKKIKYTLVGREEFEKALDEQPNELNHKGYADWLDENGAPEEAKFHRIMGDWHQSGKFKTIDHPTHKVGAAMDFRQFPKDIPWDDFPTLHNNGNLESSFSKFTKPSFNEPDLVGDERPLYVYKDKPDYAWKDYKSMRNAFYKVWQNRRNLESK